MADSDTLLQLGIDAAREGRREDARNLFGLLTRQEPNNAQAWLWLAGVAEGPEQRRAALERVVELEPHNEMAVKGLQAMGVTPGEQPTVIDEPSTPARAAHDLTDEERYAAELDSAFDDYDTLPKVETHRRDPDEEAEALGSTIPAERSSGRDTPVGSTARERRAARRTTTPIRSDEDDEDLYAPPPRRGFSPLALGLLAVIVLALLGLLLYNLLFANRGQQVAGGAAATATALARGTAGGAAGGQSTSTAGGGTGVLTATAPLTSAGPLTATAPLTDTVPPPTPTAAPEQPPAAEQPTTAAQPPAAEQPPAAAQANPNLQPAAIGAPLQANGWTYTYPNASYAVAMGKQIGTFTAQGTYLHVLVWVANNTGTAQPLPANFFALKDANNTVYHAVPQVANVLVQRGVNADLGMEDSIPANGVLSSVYLVFDVQPGAQGLALFASGNNGQGWPLNIVP